MNRRTKALMISQAVKQAVYVRDGGRCVLYCAANGQPNAHFISRAQGGLGIEENVVTLCPRCHEKYDQTWERPLIRAELREYLQSKYPDWDEQELIYRK